jgi:CubicO group peptidase (beta-lactamase class C family)
VDYGYFWWLGTGEASRTDRAYSAEGIHGQFLYINPAVDAVVVVWSAQPLPLGGAVVDDWAFFGAVADSLRRRTSSAGTNPGGAKPDKLARESLRDPAVTSRPVM